jgi:hypothetical protein
MPILNSDLCTHHAAAWSSNKQEIFASQICRKAMEYRERDGEEYKSNSVISDHPHHGIVNINDREIVEMKRMVLENDSDLKTLKMKLSTLEKNQQILKAILFERNTQNQPAISLSFRNSQEGGTQNFLTERSDGKGDGEGQMSDLDDDDVTEGTSDMKTNTDDTGDETVSTFSLESYSQGNNSSDIALLAAQLMNSRAEKNVAEQTVRSTRKSLTLRKLSIVQQVNATATEQNAFTTEIAATQTLQQELETKIEQNALKHERTENLYLKGTSELEAKRQELENVSDSSESAILMNDINCLENNFSIWEKSLSSLGVEEQRRKLEEAKEKLRSSEERSLSFVYKAEELTREIAECETAERALDSSVQDLTIAMKWGNIASHGLYEPNPSTAPLMLLLFRLYCRLQVPFKRLSASEMSAQASTFNSLRSDPAFAALDLAGHVAFAAREAGYSAGDLKSGGFSAQEIKGAGYSLQEMQVGKITAAELKALGYSALELKNVGFKIKELKSGRYSVEEILKTGDFLSEFKNCSITPAELKRHGYSAKRLKEVGYSVKELILGEYPVGEICQADYNLEELKAAGMTAADIRPCGRYSVSQLKAARYNVAEVISGGYPANEIKENYTTQEMRACRVSAQQYKDLGFLAKTLHVDSFLVSDLRGAYTVSELLEGEYKLHELKAGGFTLDEVKDKGYNLKELQIAGYNIQSVLGPDPGTGSPVQGNEMNESETPRTGFFFSKSWKR